MAGNQGASLAQTNLQLYQHLISDGTDDEGIATIERAYELSVSLFPSTYRPSGKAFVSHLIGVASALASWLFRVVILRICYSCRAIGAPI